MEFPLSGRRFGQKLEGLASMLVANSETMAALLRPYVDSSKLALVYNGIDTRAFDAGISSSSSHAKASRVVVSMVANLTSMGKQHALFIDAAERVQQPGVEFRLYGEDRAEGVTASRYIAGLHERVTRLDLEDRVTFCGFRQSPVEIMAESDIVVHPAGNESFGRSVVEAMAAGLPVVGVAAGGVGETIVDDETGFLAPENDADALGAAISRLAESPELRARMGAAGKRRARECFSLDACAEGVMDVYRRSMARPVR